MNMRGDQRSHPQKWSVYTPYLNVGRGQRSHPQKFSVHTPYMNMRGGGHYHQKHLSPHSLLDPLQTVYLFIWLYYIYIIPLIFITQKIKMKYVFFIYYVYLMSIFSQVIRNSEGPIPDPAFKILKHYWRTIMVGNRRERLRSFSTIGGR